MKKITVNFSFIIIFFWFVVLGRVWEFFAFIFALLLHELGHYIVAKKLGYQLNKFKLSPLGAELNYESLYSNRDELFISLAGPMVNVLFSILLIAMWWCFPNLYSFTNIFVFQNLCLGVLNLLPAYPLDGGRILISSLSNKTNRKKIIKKIKIINLIFILILFIFFIFSCFFDINFTFILLILLLLSGFLQNENKFNYNLIALNKNKIINFSKIAILSINREIKLIDLLKKIEKNKFTIFYLIDENNSKLISENKIIKLSLKNNLNSKLIDIIN